MSGRTRTTTFTGIVFAGAEVVALIANSNANANSVHANQVDPKLLQIPVQYLPGKELSNKNETRKIAPIPGIRPNRKDGSISSHSIVIKGIYGALSPHP